MNKHSILNLFRKAVFAAFLFTGFLSVPQITQAHVPNLNDWVPVKEDIEASMQPIHQAAQVILWAYQNTDLHILDTVYRVDFDENERNKFNKILGTVSEQGIDLAKIMRSLKIGNLHLHRDGVRYTLYDSSWSRSSFIIGTKEELAASRACCIAHSDPKPTAFEEEWDAARDSPFSYLERTHINPNIIDQMFEY